MKRYHAPFLPRVRKECAQVPLPPLIITVTLQRARRTHPCLSDYNFGDKKATGSHMTRPTTISPLICKLICPNFVPRQGEEWG